MQEKGGVGLNDDAVTGQSGGAELCDWLFCSITSNGSLTTGEQRMSVRMPEEV